MARRVDRTAELVFDSVQLLNRRLRQYRVSGELSPAESTTLSRIQQLAPVAAADLARFEGISAQSMGATLSSLTARGLVVRTRDDSDGRRILLAVSDAGREVLDRKRGARAQQLATALKGFSADELDVLDAAVPLLARMATELR